MIHNAVHHMREESERKNQFLLAIKVGQDQVATGQHQELTPDMLSKLQQTATKRIQEGYKPKSDVLHE